MTVVMRADSSGVCAIYDGPDDAPFSNREANIDRLYFHSEAPAPYRRTSRTGTFSIGAYNGNARTVKIRLFNHGQSYTPLVFGAWRLNSLSSDPDVPLSFEPAYISTGRVVNAAGSTPVAMWNNSGRNRQFGTWLHLAVDSTSVYCIVTQMRYRINGFAGTRQFNMSYFVEVMSTALAGTSPSVTTANAINITQTKLEMGRGAFDSSRRYVRRASPSNYSLANGRTAVLTGDAFRVGLRYSFDGYTMQAYAPSDDGLSNAPSSTFTATVRDVKI